MTHEVHIGDRTFRIDDFTGRKGIRVLRTLEEIAKAAPEIQKKWQEYTRQYETENTIDLDRAYARSEFGPQPLYTEEPVLNDEGHVLNGSDGRPLVRRMPMLDEQGRVRMGPDPLGHLSQEDWQASGNKLKRPRSPSVQEQLMVVFPMMIDLAEQETASLIGLIAMPNSDVKRYSKDETIKAKAYEIGDDILDAPIQDIVGLAIIAGEVLTEQYREKIVGKFGNRLKSILKLIGISLPDTPPLPTTAETSKTESSMTNVTSSTDSPSPTDGMKSEPSTETPTVDSVA